MRRTGGIKGCTHYASKVVRKFAGGGSVDEDSEEDKKAQLEGMEKRLPSENGTLPVTVIDRKTGKIDVRESARMRGRNEAEGFFQELDEKYPRSEAISLRYKAKDDRKKDKK